MKQLLILSGKGGTGKTTLTSSFIQLGGFSAYADCDVDAPNLYLISGEDCVPAQRADYFGMDKMVIDASKCVGCGRCARVCRFDAVMKAAPGSSDGTAAGLCGADSAAGSSVYMINHYSCEGCGVCQLVCPAAAISQVANAAGETQVYDGRNFLSTAKLKMGEGNSGLLVSQVKKNLEKSQAPIAIVDGSPGIGCPVIASISGVNMVIIVTEPSLSGLSDLKRIADTCKHFNVPAGVVINKYDIDTEKADAIKQWCNSENLKVIGKIPFDKNCNNLLNSKKTLVSSDTEAAAEIRRIHKETLEILKDTE